MKKNSKDLYKEIDDFFDSPPSSNQKAWGLINDFYHMVLTYMEDNNITKADLAKKLGKSRSAISQMFNKTPNITIKKMVEISDAIGLNIDITSPEIHNKIKEKDKYHVIFMAIHAIKTTEIPAQSKGYLSQLVSSLDIPINDMYSSYKY